MAAAENHILPADHTYVVATKQIKAIDDMERWTSSEAYQEYLGFILAVGEAVRGKKLRDADIHISTVSTRLLQMLENFSLWIDEIPPVQQEQRFGNKSYRDWHKRLEDRCDSELEQLLNAPGHRAIPEIGVYLKDSFGNSTRIDYGTGHEMAFIMFVACLFKIGALTQEKDLPAAGLVVLSKYLGVARKLQEVYRMEPAGSQGVWSIDDFQFVPFIWGAGQLLDEPKIEPGMIPDYAKAEMFAPDFHFFECVNYISKVKTGPFSEHSNQLWNVSAVPTWTKVYTGLIKMYRAEVLSKFPVMQHTYFGSIFTMKAAKDRRATTLAEKGPQRMRPPVGHSASLGICPPPV